MQQRPMLDERLLTSVHFGLHFLLTAACLVAAQLAVHLSVAEHHVVRAGVVSWHGRLRIYVIVLAVVVVIVVVVLGR